MLIPDEKDHLHLMLEDIEAGYKAKTILLQDGEYAVPEIEERLTIMVAT